MNPKILAWLVAIILVESVSPAVAQQRSKMHRIGYLGGSVGIEEREETFQQGLKELGYVEGQNLVIEWRFAKGDEAKLPALAKELVRQKPDVLVTHGTQPSRALKAATATIPIVVLSVGDLVGRGIVASLAKPGGNITGLTSIALDLDGKRLELLKEVVPRASRVAFLFQPHEQDELKALQAAAGALGLQMQQHEVEQASQFQPAYTVMSKQRVGALVISRNPFTNSHRKLLVDLAVKHRLPTMCDGVE